MTMDQYPTKRKTNDPQVTLRGTLKEGPNAEYIVFTMALLYFELVFIVTIPNEEQTSAPVYVKFKVNPHAGQGFVLNGGGAPGGGFRRRTGPEVVRQVQGQGGGDDDPPDSDGAPDVG